jgi:hypothetical protein
MVKMDNKILVIASVVIVSFMLFNMDGTKKEAGETVSVSSSDPIAEAGQLELTFDLSSQAGVNLWKVINVGVPSGWTYVDKVTSGGSGNRNVLCNVDSSGVSCSMLADLGSGGVVDNQLKLLFNSPATDSSPSFNGDWETYSNSLLQVAQSFSLAVSSVAGAPCTDTSWSPDTSTVCSGVSMTQTSNCGNTRNVVGTKDCSLPATTKSVSVITNSDTGSPNIIGTGEQFTATFTLSSSENVNLWKIIDVTTPAGFTFVDKQFSGASGPSHNEICNLDGITYSCSMLADSGSTVPTSATLIYTAASSQGSFSFSGDWEVFEEGFSQNTGMFSKSVSVGSTSSGCTLDSECTSSVSCTVGVCQSGVCVNQDAADGTSCGVGTCSAGVCMSPQLCSDIGQICSSSQICSGGTMTTTSDSNSCCTGGTCQAGSSSPPPDGPTCEETKKCEFWETCSDDESKCETAQWVFVGGILIGIAFILRAI